MIGATTLLAPASESCVTGTVVVADGGRPAL